MRNVTKSLRMLFVALVATLAFATQGMAQSTLLTESFENGGSVPAGWAVETLTAGNTVTFVTSTSWPSGYTAYNGTYLVMFNSFSVNGGVMRLKRTTPVSTVGYTNVTVDFAWLESTGYSGSADRVDVQWSTNGTSWTTAGTFQRYNAVQGWKIKTQVLPAGAQGQATLYIAFLFTSAYGNDCYLDFAHITAVGPPPPVTITVGTGTVSCNYPYATYWMGGRSQFIYTAAQMTAAGASPGQLTSIGFNVYSYSSQTMQNFNINMQNTTLSTLPGWVTSGWTNCFNGSYGVPGTGWQMITLQNPFVWNGQNLMLEVCFGNNGSYTSYSYVYGTTAPAGQIEPYWMDNTVGCSYTGAPYTGYTGLPNLRFVEQPYVGTLTGTVTSCYNGAPLAGVAVSCGTANTTTNAAGVYTLYNVPIGTYTASYTLAGYLPANPTVVINNNSTTTQNVCLSPIPGYLTGVVTSAATGNPIIGAEITVGTAKALSTGPNGAYTVNVYPVGTFSVTCTKLGFEDMTAGPFTFTQNNTITQNFAMLENLNIATNVVATLNTAQTSVTVNWNLPNGNYELLYDDGIQEGFVVWADAGNLNGVKFTPVGYPCTVNGGKINVGKQSDYPAGSAPLVLFKLYVYDATGPNGTPGTIIGGPYDFTPTAYGWNNFTFPPVTITSGNFYIVQKQGGSFPNAAGIAIDTTTSNLRSWQKFVTGNGPWVPASGNFMMRAKMYGPNGPVPLDLPENTITASGDPHAMFSYNPPTITGSEGVGQVIWLDETDNADIITGYQVWRLLQGQEGTPASWTSIGTPVTTTIVDNSWPTLPCNPYRWAVKTQFTGNRWSGAAFSNVIGKCWTAPVTVNVDLTCLVHNTAFTIVRLQNTVYVDTVYQGTMDTTGTITFPTVWKGTYILTVMKFGYTVYTSAPTLIMGAYTFDVVLMQQKTPPSNLVINNRSLLATWSPPRVAVELLNETWTSGSMATNGWTTSGGTNWQMSSGFGNPAPSVMFNWTPQVVDYDQYLTSKLMAGLHSPSLKLNYDYYLSNYGTTTVNTLAVELWDGATWHVLKTYTNTGNIPWTPESLDITPYTHAAALRVRFHAHGGDSYDLNNWNVDNISIIASEATEGPNLCVLGYNFYLNNFLSGFTTDTTYQIPSGQVVYGQTFTGCVNAVYGSGYSTKICQTFVSKFLCPPTELTVIGIENAAYLTWHKPMCTAGELKCYVYDDGTMENGWTFNPGYNLWLGNKMIAPATDIGTITTVKILFWNNPSATNQTLTMDFFSLAGVLLGTTQPFTPPIPAPSGQYIINLTNPVPFTGPFYAMIHYNMQTGVSHWVGYDQNGPYVAQNLGYAYDGTTFTNWSSYAGTSPGVFCIQVCGIVQGDKAVAYNAGEEQIIPQTAPVVAPAGIVSQAPEGEAPPQVTGGTENDAPLATGLMGYDIFRSQGGTGGPWALIKHLVTYPDSLSWYDFNLDPGKWCYRVTAYYDLGVYGFPGQFDSSLPDGPQCVTLVYGRPLPFCENWDGGSFAYNNWIFDITGQGNWTLNTGVGNTEPAADFSWQPIKTNYSYSIESPVIDASPWTCATIWLDFDYKLVDRNNTSLEKLTVEVFYANSWHQKDEFVNNGNVDWTSRHIDISGAKGKAFRVRFRANGVNSADILHWYVDNICMTGVCLPPTELAATQSGFNTTLTWTPPVCGSSNGSLVWFIFDDGSPENGWGINPGYNAWIGNEFPISSTTQGVIQMVKYYFWNNPAHGGDKLTIDIFDAAHTLLGSTAQFTVPNDAWDSIAINDVPFAGMFYALVHWNMAGAATNWVGYDENGPYSSQDLETYYDGTTWSKLTVAAGANPGVCMIRVLALVNGDMKAVEIVPGQPAGTGIANPSALSEGHRSGDTGDHRTMGVLLDNQSDSSQLMGYNVYRTDGFLGTGPFSKINAAPVTGTTYVDTHPSTTEPQSIFKYYVTDLFNNSLTNQPLCEAASDTITVTWPAVGINNLNGNEITIYPNPAKELVNIVSTTTIKSVEVMNFIGQSVYNNRVVNNKTMQVNVSTLAPGVYFVKITTDQGIRTTKITVTK